MSWNGANTASSVLLCLFDLPPYKYNGLSGRRLTKLMAGACSEVVVQIISSQKVVCPSREELEIECGEHVCPSEGCAKAFQTSSQLQMHITRHHRGENLRSVGKGSTPDCVYFCPVGECPRSKAFGRPFPRLGQLKQVSTRSHSAWPVFVMIDLFPALPHYPREQGLPLSKVWQKVWPEGCV